MPTITCLLMVVCLIILYVFISMRILTKGLNLFLAIQNDRMGKVIENATEIYSLWEKTRKKQTRKRLRRSQTGGNISRNYNMNYEKAI